MKALKTMLAAAWFALILATAPDGSAAEADCYGQDDPVHWATTSDIRDTRYWLREHTPLRAVNSDESWATACAVKLIWPNPDKSSGCKPKVHLNGASLFIGKKLDVTLEIPSQGRTVSGTAVSSSRLDQPNYFLRLEDDKSKGVYYIYLFDIIKYWNAKDVNIKYHSTSKIYRVEYFEADAKSECREEEPTTPGVITEEGGPQPNSAREESSAKKEGFKSLSRPVGRRPLQTDVGSGPEPKPKG